MKIIGRFFSKKDKEDLAAKSAMIGAAGLGASKLGHIVAAEATYDNFMKEKRDKSLIDKILQEAKKTNPSLKISGDSYEDIIGILQNKRVAIIPNAKLISEDRTNSIVVKEELNKNNIKTDIINYE